MHFHANVISSHEYIICIRLLPFTSISNGNYTRREINIVYFDISRLICIYFHISEWIENSKYFCIHWCTNRLRLSRKSLHCVPFSYSGLATSPGAIIPGKKWTSENIEWFQHTWHFFTITLLDRRTKRMEILNRRWTGYGKTTTKSTYPKIISQHSSHLHFSALWGARF